MNDQERQIIDDMFARLQQVANQPRDPEAERHIAERVRAQPYAPYAMAQAIVVQEQALANLNAEVERLRAEMDRMQRQPQGGLLASIFGGSRQPEPMHRQGGSTWGRSGEQASPAGYGSGMPQQQIPMGGAPGGGFGGGFGGGGPWGQRAGGGGFLQSAMTTAAGVAGGMMIANALSSAFGGDHGADAKQALAGEHGDAPAAGGFGDASADSDGGSGSFGGITDSLYQDASHDDPSADFGGDGGDDGDWT